MPSQNFTRDVNQGDEEDSFNRKYTWKWSLMVCFFPQIWTSVRANHQCATSTQRASTQPVHFHVPVMKDTLEMAKLAEVYKYWTTGAWCSIVIPLSMRRQTCDRQTCVTTSIKHCFGSSSARYPVLKCCFYLLNAILLRGSKLLELGRKDNL